MQIMNENTCLEGLAEGLAIQDRMTKRERDILAAVEYLRKNDNSVRNVEWQIVIDYHTGEVKAEDIWQYRATQSIVRLAFALFRVWEYSTRPAEIPDLTEAEAYNLGCFIAYIVKYLY